MSIEERKESPFETLMSKQPRGMDRVLNWAMKDTPTIDEGEAMISRMLGNMTVDQRSNFLPFLVGYLHAITIEGKGKAVVVRLLNASIIDALKEFLKGGEL